MHIGPLGSTVHVIRADAETVVALAGIDWNRYVRRVCLDPVRGLITLMSPSYSHEDLALIFDQIVDLAGSALGGRSKGLRSIRLRGPGDPSGTGMEPDCAFYVGERARGFFRSRRESRAAVEACVERVAPDLVTAFTALLPDLMKTSAGKWRRSSAATRNRGYGNFCPGTSTPRQAEESRWCIRTAYIGDKTNSVVPRRRYH